MKIIQLYEYLDENSGQKIRSTIPHNKHTDLIFFDLIAEDGYYLYNKNTHAIKNAIILPYYLKEEWEERAYE